MEPGWAGLGWAGREARAGSRHGGSALLRCCQLTRSVWSTDALSFMLTTCWGCSRAASRVELSRELRQGGGSQAGRQGAGHALPGPRCTAQRHAASHPRRASVSAAPAAEQPQRSTRGKGGAWRQTLPGRDWASGGGGGRNPGRALLSRPFSNRSKVPSGTSLGSFTCHSPDIACWCTRHGLLGCHRGRQHSFYRLAPGAGSRCCWARCGGVIAMPRPCRRRLLVCKAIR